MFESYGNEKVRIVGKKWAINENLCVRKIKWETCMKGRRKSLRFKCIDDDEIIL